jgi:drug/metabolite transporter (DMT)-like permease
MSARGSVHGIAAMLAAMALFVLNDATMKMAAKAMPVSEVVFLRGLMATPLIVAAIVARGEARYLLRAFQPVILLRAGFDTLNAMMFLTALTLLSLADDVAIQQIVPLIMTAYAALVLRERITKTQFIAIAAGFFGALLVANPGGEGFGLGALLAFGAAFAVAGRDLTTRSIESTIPSLVVTLSATIVLTIAAGGFAAFDAWIPPAPGAAPLLAAAAVLITAALVAITQAFRWAPVHAVAPFYYAQTVFAVIATAVIFGQMPRPLAVAGMGLVIAAGLFVLRTNAVGEPKAAPTVAAWSRTLLLRAAAKLPRP